MEKKSFPSFKTSQEVFDWLNQFVNPETVQPSSFRPERMDTIAAAAGHPELCAPSIHVAGSKGKGSVTGMITSVLEAMGLRTAQYVSPHIMDYRERITEGHRFLDERIYIEAGNELRNLEEALKDFSKPEYRIFSGNNANEGPPTYFELLTLYYFLCARMIHCDTLAVETGMGGRLDPTNIVESIVSVITVIELEHTEFLGNTITEVAGEKAGIIKPGKPVVLAEQCEEALELFRKTAAEKHSPLLYLPEIAEIRDLTVSEEGTNFTLSFKKEGFFPAPLKLSVSIPGAVQALNAALAAITLKTAFPSLDGETLQRGLRGFKIPARFEKLREDTPVIIDGAHTEKSVELCVNTFTALYGTGGMLIFGCAAGKNVEAMAAILAPAFSRIIITTPGNFKVSDPGRINGVFEKEVQRIKEKAGAAQTAPELLFIPETEKAIQYILTESRKAGLPVLGTGSFYLAAEIRGQV
ncbi:tetrahydrofolate synthase [Treponema primitia ZAS-2]|uniref:Dihydrofolate synthase/folylpolyglutamate synthase n=1 Tax=Treponema primitia (strain ATCC BAA-887 / DSM 12427 / ZAS-2) TaxID=545694 RepID=F5YLU6_TREPZ|nr:Mur ligase family protein [Treponema primitia]AEF86447.1 tetrahydrofolate synthase [Treponema primitia ZAS-2]